MLKWEVVASYEQRTKIVDVKMNKDIAVLQGVNHHQVCIMVIEIRSSSSALKPIREHIPWRTQYTLITVRCGISISSTSSRCKANSN